ncbi:MAG TPA: 16S rRNA (guanine(527)-N(7))-methyltransferase RsmG [Abditibacteriaceae bacterium]|jgi:16S rRNA (guanine527-N7)-methyltransferase
MTDPSTARSIKVEHNEGTSLQNTLLLSVAPERQHLLRALIEEVLRVNQQFNLTAVRDPQEAWIKHILDSLQGLQSGCFEDERRVIDVGAGAGFPGLALAAARPNLQVTLMDSTRKKCDFMQATAQTLELNAQVLCDRAETVGHNARFREQFDVATARAVGSLSEVCELTLPLLKVHGHLVLWRGQNAWQELLEAKKAIARLGGQASTREEALLPYSLPGHELTYHIVVINKIKATPVQFPRRVGLPKQQPL